MKYRIPVLWMVLLYMPLASFAQTQDITSIAADAWQQGHERVMQTPKGHADVLRAEKALSAPSSTAASELKSQAALVPLRYAQFWQALLRQHPTLQTAWSLFPADFAARLTTGQIKPEELTLLSTNADARSALRLHQRALAQWQQAQILQQADKRAQTSAELDKIRLELTQRQRNVGSAPVKDVYGAQLQSVQSQKQALAAQAALAQQQRTLANAMGLQGPTPAWDFVGNTPLAQQAITQLALVPKLLRMLSTPAATAVQDSAAQSHARNARSPMQQHVQQQVQQHVQLAAQLLRLNLQAAEAADALQAEDQLRYNGMLLGPHELLQSAQSAIMAQNNVDIAVLNLGNALRDAQTLLAGALDNGAVSSPLQSLTTPTDNAAPSKGH